VESFENFVFGVSKWSARDNNCQPHHSNMQKPAHKFVLNKGKEKKRKNG
jgi:hypothetical protein